MQTPAPPADRYRRRREAGELSRADTRRRLLTAADALFREQGYAATTVAAIAARAEVSLQTLYLAWGSKRALFRAAAAAAAAASDGPIEPDAWGPMIAAELAERAAGADSARAYLAAVARLFVGVVGRTARYRELYREAGATDEEIAADWREVTEASRATMLAVAADLPRRGLRRGLTDDEIGDTLWALASQEVYDLMTGFGGYTPGAFEDWLVRTLVAALCGEGDQTARSPRR